MVPRAHRGFHLGFLFALVVGLVAAPGAAGTASVQEAIGLNTSLVGALDEVVPSVESKASAAGPPRAPSAFRSRSMATLITTCAALQALDTHSTLRAMRAGGVEANGMVAPFAGRPSTLIAFKAAATAATTVAAAKIWKRNKWAGVAFIAAANAVYAVAAAHNYRVAREMR